MIRRLSSFLLLLAFLDFCRLLRSGKHLFSPSEPHVYLRLAVGSSLIIDASSLLPFLFSLDICYRSGLCTHLFPLSELSIRLHPAVGSSLVGIPLSLLLFLFSFDICYPSGLCTHLFPLSELNVRLVRQLDHLLSSFLHLCLPASWTKTCSSALALHLLN